jgi:alpha-glucosidase (family GH31 glycosyl hydrolase)
MVGESLLVAPVLRSGARARDVYLPAGQWRDYWTGKAMAGGTTIKSFPASLETIPVFERVGRDSSRTAK